MKERDTKDAQKDAQGANDTKKAHDNDTYDTYDAAKERLDEIVTDVRDKDVSLEASLDLLEEGVALANRCTELIDVASWSTPAAEADAEVDAETAETASDE
ncbi:MAG: exodeoxyribonuclease VII small subunit [Coriobacteriia bacterium]|nr:exodeoxyribonuclease VII small subunit [Coriobacteriia bacterium]